MLTMADGSCLLALYVHLTMAGWQDVRGSTMDEGCAEESHKSSSFFCRAAFSAWERRGRASGSPSSLPEFRSRAACTRCRDPRR
uniref:Putative secreted protein n=1 Tax=Ixodes ricinus TaxID=34613 RepID=A0A6B0U068_IXORI